MTNDEIRAMAIAQNITCDNVTDDELKQLHQILTKTLKASGCYRGTYKMDRLKKDRRYMTCSTDQWKGREAVSFNRDGFIGMAGWASTENIAPIRAAVTEWIHSARAA